VRAQAARCDIFKDGTTQLRNVAPAVYLEQAKNNPPSGATVDDFACYLFAEHSFVSIKILE
jgi:hypothetical protein